MSRRTLLKGGGASLAGLTVIRRWRARRTRSRAGAGEHALASTSPHRFPPPARAGVRKLLDWEELDSRLTPADDFFVVSHYAKPCIAAQDWRLDVAGLIARPQTLTLSELKARTRREVEFTLECSGNTGLPFFIGGIGNARWVGTPLAPILERAGGCRRTPR